MFYFHPYLGKIPILTSIFFKGVGSTTNQKWLILRPNETNSKLLPKAFKEIGPYEGRMVVNNPLIRISSWGLGWHSGVIRNSNDKGRLAMGSQKQVLPLDSCQLQIRRLEPGKLARSIIR